MEPITLQEKTIADRVTAIEEEIASIRERNFEKDISKRFESSFLRVAVIMVVTYGIVFGYLYFLEVNKPELNAIVPTLGFNLSTWSLSFVKTCWLKRQREHDQLELTTKLNNTVSTRLEEHSNFKPAGIVSIDNGDNGASAV